MLDIKKLGVIGLGKMGQAIVAGMLKKQVITPNQLMGCDASEDIRNRVSESLGIQMFSDAKKLASTCDVLLLAVKPHHIKMVCDDIYDSVHPNQLVISVAAAISTTYMEKRLPKDVPVIRVMPNTPALINQGMSALCQGKSVRKHHMALAMEMFEAVGETASVDEKMMDAVTAISGSGPAYMFLMLEAMADAGLKMGLPKPLATQLAAQTMLGSAKLVMESGEMPVKLKDDVTTPAGTTIEGLVEFENNGFRSTVINAVLKAKERSEQLSQND